ncbi:MAG: cytochrome c [Thermoanaerobaculia bacterium]|nr:cytochrome c [Thermoanaerobaculia bacterium]
MYNQQKYKPLAESSHYPNGMASRSLPAHTVPRGFLREDAALYKGQGADGKFVTAFPVPVTKELLERGQQRFEIYCSPCHSRQGDGLGMVVRRGFKQPPSYHIDRLRQERHGYFFDVITNGFGEMNGYAAQIPPEDRWAIVSYIRTLQYSQHVNTSELGAEDRRLVEEAAAKPASHPSGSSPKGH